MRRVLLGVVAATLFSLGSSGFASEGEILKNPVPHTRGSVAKGKALYLRHCRSCHDFDGKGQSGIDFVPTPLPDLTNPETFKYGIEDGQMFAVIRDGTKTDMESFKAKLSEQEIWHLVNYVHSLRKKPRPIVEGEEPAEEAKPAAPPAEEEKPVDPKELKNPIAYNPGSVAQGKAVYLRNCRSCHDFDGKGRSGIDFVPTPLPDLTDPNTWKYGTTDGEMFTVIKNGTKTDMESFKDKLTAEQIWQTVNYIRSIGPKNLRPDAKNEAESKESESETKSE